MRSCDEGLIENFDCIEQANFVTPVSPCGIYRDSLPFDIRKGLLSVS